jgi:hypothetical protein
VYHKGWQQDGKYTSWELERKLSVVCYGHSFYICVGSLANIRQVVHSGNDQTVLAATNSNVVQVFFHYTG